MCIGCVGSLAIGCLYYLWWSDQLTIMTLLRELQMQTNPKFKLVKPVAREGGIEHIEHLAMLLLSQWKMLIPCTICSNMLVQYLTCHICLLLARKGSVISLIQADHLPWSSIWPSRITSCSVTPLSAARPFAKHILAFHLYLPLILLGLHYIVY